MHQRDQLYTGKKVHCLYRHFCGFIIVDLSLASKQTKNKEFTAPAAIDSPRCMLVRYLPTYKT